MPDRGAAGAVAIRGGNREARQRAGLRAFGRGGGQSPITLQMKPIMMKNPLNSAIRPRPP
jgi:hypothetical protein